MWMLLACFWGFAEATLFFIIPDVILTRAALKLGFVKAVSLAFFATIAAIIGGALMYQWGSVDAPTAFEIIDHVPGISPPLIQSIEDKIAANWQQALFWGGLQGQPFKLFMLELGEHQIAWGLILPIAFAARFCRFLLTITLAVSAKAMLSSIFGFNLHFDRILTVIWAVSWGLIYLLYFTIFGF